MKIQNLYSSLKDLKEIGTEVGLSVVISDLASRYNKLYEEASLNRLKNSSDRHRVDRTSLVSAIREVMAFKIIVDYQLLPKKKGDKTKIVHSFEAVIPKLTTYVNNSDDFI